MGDVTQRQFDRPSYATATVAPGSSTVSLVSITPRNANGKAMGKTPFDVFLSDSTVGAGLTATTASGAVAAGASGTDMGDLTSKKYKRVQSSAPGIYILSITDTGKTAFYVCALLERGRKVAPQIKLLATANYG